MRRKGRESSGVKMEEVEVRKEVQEWRQAKKRRERRRRGKGKETVRWEDR